MANLHEYFWSFVTKTPECWLWTGRSLNHGYGQLWVNGKRWIASRLAWHLTHGSIPAGHCVLHRCDNPQCVRPEHLFLGDQATNLADMRQKKRHRAVMKRGTMNNRAKLTWAQVEQIRRDYAGGRSLRWLGRRYGVWHTTISDVVRHKTW